MVNACEAGMVTHTFTGTVADITLMGTGSLPFQIGASVTGTYLYDNTTVYTAFTGGRYEYNNAQTGVSFLVNGTYAYSHSQAAPLYSTPNQDYVLIGPPTDPGDYIDFQTGSLDYPSTGGLRTVGALVALTGTHGMLSAYNPSDLSGVTVDYSKANPNGSLASFQTYTYSGGVFTEFERFNVDLVTIDGAVLGAASAVPEPSTFALLGLGGVGMAIGTYRRRLSKKSA